TVLRSSSSVAIGSRNAHASLPSLPALHSYTCAPSAWSVTTALSPGAAIAGGTCADAAPASVEAATMERANIAMRMGRPPPLADCRVETSRRAPARWLRAALRHRPLEILVDLVEEAGGGEPFLIGAHQQRQVLGHEARLDRGDRDLLQGRREFRELGVVVELGAVREPARPGIDRGDRIGGRLLALLVLAIMPRHRAVGRLGLHHLAVWRHQHRRHQPERAVALRDGVGLHVAVVILASPD